MCVVQPLRERWHVAQSLYRQGRTQRRSRPAETSKESAGGRSGGSVSARGGGERPTGGRPTGGRGRRSDNRWEEDRTDKQVAKRQDRAGRSGAARTQHGLKADAV